ncbi:MAG: VOC family protein [Promethearchaeota archaeon]
MKKKLNIDFGELKIAQLGFVFKDIESKAKLMEEIYGVPKFTFMDNVRHEIENRGVKSQINLKMGFSRFFDMQIELIEWKEGDCIYKDFLDQGREGLQHISFFVDELDPYIEEFKRAGFDVIHQGRIGKQRFAYFDTEDTFGLLFEFQETVKRRKKKT